MAIQHITALKRMALCHALSASELEAVAAIIEPRRVVAGGDLFREGEPGDGMFLVVSGEINIIKRGPSGEHSLARDRRGAVASISDLYGKAASGPRTPG